jgi:nitroimidazol reductase NimA-like FMN-containing flavoprotein (pyridoxamine 5'-phosphate oxidase superfamily)
MPAKLTLDEVHAYLDSKPGWIVLTTVGRDGMPHSIPIGYFRVGDEVYLGCRAGTQKVRNVECNPNVSLLLQSGGSMQDIKGVMIQGEASVLTAPDDLLRMSREAARLRGTPEDQLPTEPRAGSAYIRVVPKKIISWDYAR